MVKCLSSSPTQKQVKFNLTEDLGNCPLTWLASLNSLKMPLMSEVMLRAHLSLWPHTLLYNLRWPCQRGRATSGTLLLLGKRDPNLVPPLLPGLQLPVEPGPNATPCWTQSNGQRTGSGCMLQGWENHLTGGQSSSLCTGSVQNSPWPSYSCWPRDRMIQEMRKENNLALALQHSSEWSGRLYSMMCCAARALQGCIANLMSWRCHCWNPQMTHK